jgi:ssDNA-binding Zn-finger/Zn-ribbon topoisomerase 1
MVERKNGGLEEMSAYTDKIVPGKPCPKCGGNRIVKAAKRRVRDDLARPEVRHFVGCANFTVKGCDHTEPFTEEIQKTIDDQPKPAEDWLTI